MAQFFSDGFAIAYDDLGDGEPVILLHGFSANRRTNWKLPGWYSALADAGFRVIAADARGHGRSQLSRRPADYHAEGIAADTIRLMDHLELDRAHIVGYSMGGRNAGWLLSRYPERCSSVVIGGAGINLLSPEDADYWAGQGYATTADNQPRDSLARPTLAPLLDGLTRLGGRTAALSACLLGGFANMASEEFEGITVPTLVICGERDTVSGHPEPLAASIPGARSVVAPGASHLSAITDRFYRTQVIEFLREHPMSGSTLGARAA